jgi:F0F1-type ATP synthase delta subunit
LAKKGNLTEVVVRDKRNFDSWKDEINKLSKEFDLEEINIVENEKIIGGFILKNSKKLLDNSYKTKLLRLFEKISK